MNLTSAAQYATEALAIVLIFRLLWLRDRQDGVYTVFVGFLLVQLIGSLAYFACGRWRWLDYRVVWFSFTTLLAFFSLWLVYSLSKAILAELPGILRFSRILLNLVFLAAIVLAFSSAKSEYWLTPAKNLHERIDRLIYVFFLADKGISTAAVLILIVILAFILWFPVRMTRNLAIFSVGFVVFFASKTGLKLLTMYSLLDASTPMILDICVSAVLILCFVYWIAFIGPKGQSTVVRWGHGWRLDEQKRLLDQLESLNGALVRSSQRLPL
jgi:hypothetical protein